MRLPVHGKSKDFMTAESIDPEQFRQMIDIFMERGFTYFDTGYVYHEGKSGPTGTKSAREDSRSDEAAQGDCVQPVWQMRCRLSEAVGCHERTKACIRFSGWAQFFII